MSTVLADIAQSQWVSTWVAPIFLLGFLIFVHEFGHFLFAKIFDVPVEQFSFGFGPRLTGVVYKGTDYRLNLIPLGGYVKMVGDDPFEPEEFMRPDGFLAQPAWKRLFIVGAGPIFNLVLPIFLFASVYMAGAPQPIAWVGSVQQGSLAEAAGLSEGDRIVEVDGEPVRFWSEVQLALDDAATQGRGLALSVERDGQRLGLELPPPPGAHPGESDRTHGLGFDDMASLPRVTVLPGSAAEQAGLESGDLITAIDGQPIQWWHEATRRFESGAPLQLTVLRRDASAPEAAPTEHTASLTPAAPGALELPYESDAPMPAYLDGGAAVALTPHHPGLPYGLVNRELTLSDVLAGKPAEAAGIAAGDSLVGLGAGPIEAWSEVVSGVSGALNGEVELLVLRDRHLFAVSVAPEVESFIGPDGNAVRTARVGIGSAAEMDTLRIPQRLGPVAALAKGAAETGLVIATTVRVLSRIVTGDIPVAESIGGPIAIVKYAQASASVSIFSYFKMMALISVSLGLMNLLPIPLLDGGHILFFSVEAVRGRPVSLKFREISHQVGLIFLLTLIAFALINDTRLHILN